MNEKHSSTLRPYLILTTVYIRKLCFKHFRNLKHEERRYFLKELPLGIIITYIQVIQTNIKGLVVNSAHGPPEHDKLK